MTTGPRSLFPGTPAPQTRSVSLPRPHRFSTNRTQADAPLFEGDSGAVPALFDTPNVGPSVALHCAGGTDLIRSRAKPAEKRLDRPVGVSLGRTDVYFLHLRAGGRQRINVSLLYPRRSISSRCVSHPLLSAGRLHQRRRLRRERRLVYVCALALCPRHPMRRHREGPGEKPRPPGPWAPPNRMVGSQERPVGVATVCSRGSSRAPSRPK